MTSFTMLAMIWFLLGIGVVALTLLALPSLISVLRLTGYLVLPYQTVAYIQHLLNWIYIVLDAFFGSAWVLCRTGENGIKTQTAWQVYCLPSRRS